jgi:starch synthase (maltosyl-transferring)
MKSRDRKLDAPIRLALVSTELRPGGAERCLTKIALGLNRTEFTPEVYVLAPPPPPAEAQLATALMEAKVPVTFLEAKHKSQFLSVVRKLRALLARQAPDVVQSFLFHANVVSALAARRMNVPVLAGLRVAQQETFRQFVERRLIRRFAGFVCVSQAVADHAVNHGRLPREKLHVIPNGIDVDEIARAVPVDWTTLGVPPDRRVILFVGRLERQKGADLLLAAASHFLPHWPQHDLVLIGEGTIRGTLLQDAVRHGVASRTHWPGWRADVANCIAAAELVVIPSRYDGMSNVLLEAMAAGKPVVAADVEGVAEALGDLAPQQTCAPNSTADLARSIEYLLRDDDVRGQLGAANRNRAAELFSLRQMLAAYAQLFRNVVST